MTYRSGGATLLHHLEGRLAPFGFATLEPTPELRAAGVERCFRRKTWNTNRGVVVCALPSGAAIGTYAEAMRAPLGAFIGSSWWSQLGLQLVVQIEGAPPAREVLDGLVDKINTQGVLIQSVFCVDLETRQHTSARTWGQVITGKFQDAVLAAIQAFAEGDGVV